jgi:hypothetical protein
MSNQLYERRDEAEDAAHTAYPDIRLESNEASAEASDRRILIAIVVLLLAVIGLGILLRKTEREELE